MEQLVDMYSDPAVNDELRQRLPQANKTDFISKWKQELMQMSQNEDGVAT